jgi:hypothetical protein
MELFTTTLPCIQLELFFSDVSVIWTNVNSKLSNACIKKLYRVVILKKKILKDSIIHTKRTDISKFNKKLKKGKNGRIWMVKKIVHNCKIRCSECFFRQKSTYDATFLLITNKYSNWLILLLLFFSYNIVHFLIFFFFSKNLKFKFIVINFEFNRSLV